MNRQALGTRLHLVRGILSARLQGQRRPLFVGASLTSRCDGHCLYCRRADTQGEDLDTDTWIHLLTQMSRAGTWQVSFTGGEPLLRKDVGRLMYEAQRLGLRVNIGTSGSLLVDRLDEVARADSVMVSLDGPEDVMDALRGQGSHARAVRAVERARAVGMPVSLHATLTSTSVGRVEETLDEARSLGVRVGFAPLRPVPLGDRPQADLFADSVHMKEAMGLLVRRKLAGDLTVLNSLPCLRHLAHWDQPTPTTCSAGRIYARLEHDGTVFACGDLVTGGDGISALEKGFQEAFDALPEAGCDRCWCDTRVEMNLLWAGHPVAAMEAALR